MRLQSVYIPTHPYYSHNDDKPKSLLSTRDKSRDFFPQNIKWSDTTARKTAYIAYIFFSVCSLGVIPLFFKIKNSNEYCGKIKKRAPFYKKIDYKILSIISISALGLLIALST